MRNNILKTQRSTEPFQEIKIEEIKNQLRDYVKGEFEKKKDEFVIEIADTVKQEIDDEREVVSKDSEISEIDTKKQLKKDIISEYIYPDNKETIKSLLENRKFYSKFLQYVRVLKILFSAIIVPGLLLSDTQFPGRYLSYVAGISSFLVACFELGDRMIVESNKKRAEKINNILESVGIKYKVTDPTLDDPLKNNSGPPVISKKQLNIQNNQK
jgi:hypothetical protein